MWSVTDSSQHICFLRHIKISIFSFYICPGGGVDFYTFIKIFISTGKMTWKRWHQRFDFWGWNQFIILPLAQTGERIHSFYCFPKFSICFHQIVHLLLCTSCVHARHFFDRFLDTAKNRCLERSRNIFAYLGITILSVCPSTRALLIWGLFISSQMCFVMVDNEKVRNQCEVSVKALAAQSATQHT